MAEARSSGTGSGSGPERVRPGDPRYGVIWVDPDRMHGEACFHGTRVPVRTLFEYLEGGEALDEFLAGFPEVTREQAVRVLELAREGLLSRGQAA